MELLLKLKQGIEDQILVGQNKQVLSIQLIPVRLLFISGLDIFYSREYLDGLICLV